MKKIIITNLLLSIIIIITAVFDLLCLFVLGYPSFFTTVMLIVAGAGIIGGGIIGMMLKKNEIVFEENFISNHLSFSTEWLNDFSTLIAGCALLLAVFMWGYINIVTIGAACYTVITSFEYLKNDANKLA